jgi:hypothetical protein
VPVRRATKPLPLVEYLYYRSVFGFPPNRKDKRPSDA